MPAHLRGNHVDGKGFRNERVIETVQSESFLSILVSWHRSPNYRKSFCSTVTELQPTNARIISRLAPTTSTHASNAEILIPIVNMRARHEGGCEPCCVSSNRSMRVLIEDPAVPARGCA